MFDHSFAARPVDFGFSASKHDCNPNSVHPYHGRNLAFLQQRKAAYLRSKHKHPLIERAQPNRTPQPLVQVGFDLPIAQPAPILGLNFQPQIIPNPLAGTNGLELQAHITTTSALGLRHVDVHRAPSDRQLAQVMPITLKIMALVTTTPAAIQDDQVLFLIFPELKIQYRQTP